MCIHITQKYLREHSNEIFVFGDNILRKGHGGAAALRNEPNTYGFITKKDLEQAQLDTLMKYEAMRKARKEEKKKVALVEAEKQKMLNTINRAVGGQQYKYRDGSNRWDRCY